MTSLEEVKNLRKLKEFKNILKEATTDTDRPMASNDVKGGPAGPTSSQQPCNGANVFAESCDTGGPLAHSFAGNMKIGGQIPQVGDLFFVPNSFTAEACGTNTMQYSAMSIPSHLQGWFKVTQVQSVNPGTNSITDFPVVPNPPTGCSSGCSAWSGHQNWINTFTSLPNFSSSNPNQPCNFLCLRHTQWTNTLSTVNPNSNYVNQLQCKIDEVTDLMQTHNCANSNAPNC